MQLLWFDTNFPFSPLRLTTFCYSAPASVYSDLKTDCLYFLQSSKQHPCLESLILFWNHPSVSRLKSTCLPSWAGVPLIERKGTSQRVSVHSANTLKLKVKKNARDVAWSWMLSQFIDESLFHFTFIQNTSITKISHWWMTPSVSQVSVHARSFTYVVCVCWVPMVCQACLGKHFIAWVWPLTPCSSASWSSSVSVDAFIELFITKHFVKICIHSYFSEAIIIIVVIRRGQVDLIREKFNLLANRFFKSLI
jgi:hypothetical protein